MTELFQELIMLGMTGENRHGHGVYVGTAFLEVKFNSKIFPSKRVL